MFAKKKSISKNVSMQFRSTATRRKRMRANSKKKIIWRHRQYVFVPSLHSNQQINPFVAEEIN